MKKNSPLKIFSNTVYVLIDLKFLQTSMGKFQAKNVNFNWGILWHSLNQLIMVILLAILFSSGIKGQGREIEYFVFLILFWFGFQKTVTGIAQLKVPAFAHEKKYVNSWTIAFAISIFNLVPVLIRFILCLLVVPLFGFVIEYFELISAFLLLFLFGCSYGCVVSGLFRNAPFLIEAHVFFLSGLFFISSVIIPVPTLPPNIRDVLLYNPLVHLFEWVKFPTTGIYYEFIDINYFLYWLLAMLLLSPIFLQMKYLQEKKNENPF